MSIFDSIRQAIAPKNIFQSVSDYFAPSETETRLRDVIREVPRQLATQIGQPIIRSFGAVGAKIAARDVRAQFRPTGEFQEQLLGTKEPIGFATIGKEMRVAFGGEAKRDRPFIDPTVGFLVAGLDVLPPGAPGGRGITLVFKKIAPGIKKLANYRFSLLSKSTGVSTGVPSYSIEAPSIPKPGLETKVSPSLIRTLEPTGAVKSIRYTEPSQIYNLADPFIPTDYSKVSRLMQLNKEPFVDNISRVTGLVPDVRIKTKDSFVGKIARYKRAGKDPKEIADNLAGRITVEPDQIENIFILRRWI